MVSPSSRFFSRFLNRTHSAVWLKRAVLHCSATQGIRRINIFSEQTCPGADGPAPLPWELGGLALGLVGRGSLAGLDAATGAVPGTPAADSDTTTSSVSLERASEDHRKNPNARAPNNARPTASAVHLKRLREPVSWATEPMLPESFRSGQRA